MTIQLIVEGYGEVDAFPVLLRRFIEAAQAWEIKIARPLRGTRYQLARREDLQKFIRVALKQPECRAILVLLDGDLECPAEFGPRLQIWAAEAAQPVPCRVVIAHAEYEAWFLAAIESLRGYRGIRNDAEPFPEPEKYRGAKEQLETRMQVGDKYRERTDQPALSGRLSLADAYRRSRSFRKLVGSFGFLAQAMGQDINAWPPSAWIHAP